MPKTWSLCTRAESNLRDSVLTEVEKNSFIAVPGKGGHRELGPSKLCVPARGDLVRSFYSNSPSFYSNSGLADKIRVCGACNPLIWPQAASLE